MCKTGFVVTKCQTLVSLWLYNLSSSSTLWVIFFPLHDKDSHFSICYQGIANYWIPQCCNLRLNFSVSNPPAPLLVKSKQFLGRNILNKVGVIVSVAITLHNKCLPHDYMFKKSVYCLFKPLPSLIGYKVLLLSCVRLSAVTN